jgi:hypothetical protein
MSEELDARCALANWRVSGNDNLLEDAKAIVYCVGLYAGGFITKYQLLARPSLLILNEPILFDTWREGVEDTWALAAEINARCQCEYETNYQCDNHEGSPKFDKLAKEVMTEWVVLHGLPS